MKPSVRIQILVLFFLLASWKTVAISENIFIQSGLQEITLCSRLKHKEVDYGNSAFNFKYAMRSDNAEWLRTTYNDEDIFYGNLSINGDSDWFSVSAGGDNPNRIRDLGALPWSEIQAIPMLPAIPRLETGIRGPVRGESWEKSSDERVTKAVKGHIYLAHIKDDESDRYVIFRVEALTPSDNCTISWKIVPSPE